MLQKGIGKYKEEKRKKIENSLAEIQTELKILKSRMDNAEEGISDWEDIILEITHTGQQKT